MAAALGHSSRFFRIFAVPGLLLTLGGAFAPPAAAQPGRQAAIWAMVSGNHDGEAWRTLFQQPAAWASARAAIEGLAYADHNFADVPDGEIRGWMRQLRDWRLKFGLEVGAVKIWGTTGAAAFAKDRPIWDRLIADGAQISSVAMDEPLRVSINVLHQDQAYAVEQTAAFMALVRRAFPSVQIGDIEGYTGEPVDLLGFIDALQARLARMHVRGLDYFRVDPNWMAFSLPGHQAGWAGLREIERGCHQRGLPFSLVYWAADYPMKSRKGLATERTWLDGVMDEGARYAATGGQPDSYVIESWLPDAPARTVPDSDPTSFMGSVLAFARRY